MAFAEFRAGFARIDATPPLGLPLVGYFTTRIADGVLDPLYIDCVAVSDGTNSALIYCVGDLQLSNTFLAKATSRQQRLTPRADTRYFPHASPRPLATVLSRHSSTS